MLFVAPRVSNATHGRLKEIKHERFARYFANDASSNFQVAAGMSAAQARPEQRPDGSCGAPGTGGRAAFQQW